MNARRLRLTGLSIAAIGGAGITWIGGRYLLNPGSTAATFGVPDPPPGSDPFLRVKGIRDVGTGLLTIGLLLNGQPRATGVALLAASIIPAGDALIVHSHGGPASMSLGVHGATALTMVIGAIALLAGAAASEG